MIQSFRDRETKAIFEGSDLTPKEAKRARKRLPESLWRRARAKLDEIDAVTNPVQLNTPSNRLEKLSGDRAEYWSIRINRRHRICFEWADGDAWNVEVVDDHD